MDNVKPLKNQNAQRASFEPLKSRLKLTCSSKVNIIPKSDILYLKSDSNYCAVHLIDGSTLLCSQTMKLIAGKLNSSQFFRPHQSYVFNVMYLRSVASTMAELFLEGDITIPVSRSKRSELRHMLELWYD